MSEQQNIDYKQSWHDEYLKWVCGFANAIGGMIFIGMDDNGNVVHLADYAKLMEDIPNKIRNSMGIICDVQLEEKEGKNYISIKVNPYSVAVSLRGRYYYRTGSTKMELTGVELNEFLLKKAGKTWDDVVEEGASMKDIDEKSLSKFIEDSKEEGRMPETKGLSAFQLLEKLQLTEGHKLKRAAIVLFGKDPNRFYPNIQVKIGRFGKDSTDLKFQEIVEGNLVHRTYMGADIQMRVYDDRLSLWNEGGLPFGLTLEELKREHNSRPRNPKIAKACFMAGYIDTWGRGTLKIYNSCKEHGLPEPAIFEKDGGFMVALYNTAKAHEDDGTIGGQMGGQIGGQIDYLTDRQKEVLILIKENNKISRKEIAHKLGIAESAVQKHLKALTDAKIMERVGTKNGYWKILIK